MKIAKRNDWKTESMPAKFMRIAVDKDYSQEEFDEIIVGMIPQQMEDKWFIFYEAPWLYLHRSWTGFCIFKVRFESGEERIKIVEVQVNRNPEQYTEVDKKQDASLLLILISSLIKTLDSQAKLEQQNRRKEYIKNRSIAPKKTPYPTS